MVVMVIHQSKGREEREAVKILVFCTVHRNGIDGDAGRRKVIVLHYVPFEAKSVTIENMQQ